MSLSGGRPFWIFGSCREAPECSGVVGGPPKRPVVVGWPSQMSGRGLEALLDVRQLLGGPPRCLGAFPVVWHRSGGLPGCPAVVGRPSRMTGSGWLSLPDVR